MNFLKKSGTPVTGGSVKRKKNNKKYLLIALAAVIAVGGAMVVRGQSAKKKNDRSAEVKTAEVTRGKVSSELSSSGVIMPKDTYNITALAEGEVIFAGFEEGDQVKEGDVLYMIDASSMESKIKSADNSLTRSQENYEAAKKDYDRAVSDYSGNTYKSTRTGFIRQLNIDVGDRVGNNTEIATIYNDSTMRLRMPFLSGEAQALMTVGSQAIIILEDTAEQLPGVVTAISNMDEVLSGGRLVRYVTIDVANPGGLTETHQATALIGDCFSVETASFTPVTDSPMRANISASVEVEALLVHEGDFVTVGTPIFRMKSDDAQDLIRSFKNSMDTAQERVESAQTNVDSVTNDYDNYTITAPISGQVITKNIKVGDTLSRSSGSGATTMAVIYDLSQMTFEMSIDEMDVRSIKVGQKVEVTADALEGQVFQGRVTNVSLASSQSNGVTNYPVTVLIEKPGDLLPGMNVDGTIILDETENALTIPVGALQRGNRVYVKDDSVKEAQGPVPAGFRAVEVKTGITSDNSVEITEGLSEGDVVYVNPTANNDFSMFGNWGGPGMGGPGMGGQGGYGGNRNGGSGGSRNGGNSGGNRRPGGN